MDEALKLALWLLLFSPAAFGQFSSFNGQCQLGGQAVVTQGLLSTGTQPIGGGTNAPTSGVIASYPLCTVTVYLTGTTNIATIFRDGIGTPLGNPFTANVDGSYLFFAGAGNYDITTSAGGMPNPFTLTDVALGGSSSGGSFLPLAGGTLSGTLTLAPSTTTLIPLVIPPGVAPTTPVNGSVWTTNLGVFAFINGTTVGPFASAIPALVLQTNGTPNGSQVLFNAKAGANMTITDDGFGNITFSSSGSGGTSAWNGLTVPTGNLTLAMATFTSAFQYTSGLSNAFQFTNTTVATSTVPQNSPGLTLTGSCWNGAAGVADTWTIQDSVAAGGNGTLTFGANTGCGYRSVSVPNLGTAGNVYAASTVGGMTGAFSSLPNGTTLSTQNANNWHAEGPFGGTAVSQAGTMTCVFGSTGRIHCSNGGGGDQVVMFNTDSTSGQSGTALALAAAPTQCSIGNVASGIAANGNANCVAAGAGTISGITTSAASGLSGGALSGVVALTLITTCTDTQILAWSAGGSSWGCANAGAGTITGATANGGLVATGATLGLIKTCSNTQVLAWTSGSSSWGCASPGTGTITAVVAGTGLTGGGSSGSVTLNMANVSTTVNSQTCTLGSNCTIPFQTNTVNNTSLAGLNFLTSTANTIGLTVTPTNGASDQEKMEVTGNLIWNDHANPNGNFSIATGTNLTTFSSVDFGASPVVGIFNYTDTSTTTTDASVDLYIQVPTTSYHNPFRVDVDAFAQFQVCNTTAASHLGITVICKNIT